MTTESKSQTFFQTITKLRNVIIWVFYAQYAYLVGMIGYAAYLTAQHTDRAVVYEWGKLSGIIALVYFCLSLLPGIARRFGIRLQIIQTVMLFRRQIGVSAFLFGFFHYSALRMFPILLSGVPLNLNPPFFEVFGFLSLYPMTLMFLTSNDFSVKKMGIWWRRVHSLAYILAWTIFLHVALQDGKIWMYLIMGVAVFETVSLVYFWLRKNRSS